MKHIYIKQLFTLPDPDPAAAEHLSNRIMSGIDAREQRQALRNTMWERVAIAASVCLFTVSAAATLPEFIGPAGGTVFAAEHEIKLYELVTQDHAFDPLEVIDIALHATAR